MTRTLATSLAWDASEARAVELDAMLVQRDNAQMAVFRLHWPNKDEQTTPCPWGSSWPCPVTGRGGGGAAQLPGPLPRRPGGLRGSPLPGPPGPACPTVAGRSPLHRPAGCAARRCPRRNPATPMPGRAAVIALFVGTGPRRRTGAGPLLTHLPAGIHTEYISKKPDFPANLKP